MAKFYDPISRILVVVFVLAFAMALLATRVEDINPIVVKGLFLAHFVSALLALAFGILSAATTKMGP